MKAGGYSDRNIVFQLTTIKMRTKVFKITTKIIHIKSHLKYSERKYLDLVNAFKKKKKKTEENESDVHKNCSWVTWNIPQFVGKDSEIRGGTGVIQSRALGKISRNTRSIIH